MREKPPERESEQSEILVEKRMNRIQSYRIVLDGSEIYPNVRKGE